MLAFTRGTVQMMCFKSCIIVTSAELCSCIPVLMTFTVLYFKLTYLKGKEMYTCRIFFVIVCSYVMQFKFCMSLLILGDVAQILCDSYVHMLLCWSFHKLPFITVHRELVHFQILHNKIKNSFSFLHWLLLGHLSEICQTCTMLTPV